MPEAPEPNQPRERSLNSLEERLKAFETQRAPKASQYSETQGIGEGYRLLAGLIGGVLGGLGLGWTFDHFVHTSPIGLICGHRPQMLPHKSGGAAPGEPTGTAAG